MLPLTTGVVLPQMVLTVALETDEARAAANAAGDDGHLLLVPRIDGRYATVGVVARIESTGTLPNGTPALVVRAVQRARVGTGVIGAGEALWLQAEPVAETEPTERARELAIRAEGDAAGRRRPPRRPPAGRVAATASTIPRTLADAAGWWPDLSIERKVELLETVDVTERVAQVLAWAKEALAELELTERIRTDVSDGMEKTQREFLLRQQLAAIRKELGDGDDDDAAAGVPRSAWPSWPTRCPRRVRNAVEREIDRLERTDPQSMEHGWIRTWLDTVLDLPWGKRSPDHLDLADARAGARRRPPRPRRGQGAHRRVPRRAQAAGRAGRGGQR